MTESITEIPKEFEKALDSKKVVFGLKKVTEMIQSKNAEMVVFAANSPEDVAKNLEKISEISSTPIKKYAGTNAELGIKLKRAHSVMVAAIVKSN